MPFDLNFNPSLWFVCKLCREAFTDTDKLKAHKLKSHLAECLKIRCIVFEERLLDHEWTPSPLEFVCKQDQILNLTSALPQETNDGLTETDVKPQTELRSQSQKQIEIKNPYVLLKRLTAQVLDSQNCASAVKIGTAVPATQSKAAHNCKVGLKDTNGKIFSRRKQDFASGSIPYSYSQLEQGNTDNYDGDNVHIDEIREFNNTVIIKTVPYRHADDSVCLEPQDTPISILPAPSPSPSQSSPSSKIINPVKGSNTCSSNSLQEPPHQLPLRRNIADVAPKPIASPNFRIPKTPLKSEFMPTCAMTQPQKNYSYSHPASLNFNGQFIQAQDETSENSTSFHQNETKNSSRLKAKFDQFSVSTGTAEPPASPSLKVEFIEYEDLIGPNPNVEMISIITEAEIETETEEPQEMSRVNSHYCRGQSNEIQKRFVCPICRAFYSSESSLNRHCRTHSYSHSHNRQYQCRHCDSVFKSQSDLREHLVARHRWVSFRCQFCGKFLHSKSDLIGHEAVHTGARPYKCDFPNCGAQLSNRATLYVHKRTVHREELGHEEFPCPICGKIFGLRCFVTKHVKRAHPDQVIQILS